VGQVPDLPWHFSTVRLRGKANPNIHLIRRTLTLRNDIPEPTDQIPIGPWSKVFRFTTP
jgi:hypothetical protein